jgi:hypothetical protein
LDHQALTILYFLHIRLCRSTGYGLIMSSDEPPSKRRRTIGPTLPPANLDERPPQSPDHSDTDSSDDDDFGPALPGTSPARSTPDDLPSTSPQASPAPTKRDEWMTIAPESGDWSSRIDPTKLKSRGFNSGKGAKGPAVKTGGDSSGTRLLQRNKYDWREKC